MMVPPAIAYRCARREELSHWTRRPLATWLSPCEMAELHAWRDTARRAQWLDGRALVKELLHSRAPFSATEPRAIEVLSRNAEGRMVQPAVAVAGQMLPWSISISHTDAFAAAAISTASDFAVGIDITPHDAASLPVLSRWFTPAERQWIGPRPANAALVWAAKEAIYKAINCGEPLAPEEIEIFRGANEALACSYRGEPLKERCLLTTWEYEGHVLALAVVDARDDKSRMTSAECREVAYVS